MDLVTCKKQRNHVTNKWNKIHKRESCNLQDTKRNPITSKTQINQVTNKWNKILKKESCN